MGLVDGCNVIVLLGISVRIDLEDELPDDSLPPFLYLSEIDPTGVMYELVGTPPTQMFMMRLRGLDTNPLFS